MAASNIRVVYLYITVQTLPFDGVKVKLWGHFSYLWVFGQNQDILTAHFHSAGICQ